MTLTFQLGLASVKLNQRAKCLHQKSFGRNLIVWTHRDTNTHTPDWLLYLDHWSSL